MGETHPIRLKPRRASAADVNYAVAAVDLISVAASEGFEIARRSIPEVREKIVAGHAVILLDEAGVLVGFGYYSPWAGPSVSYSGIVMSKVLRGQKYGIDIVRVLLEVGVAEYPTAVHFMLTTNPAMRAIAEGMGFVDAGLEFTTADPNFWAGCAGCNKHCELNTVPPSRDNPHRTPLGTVCCCKALVLAPRQ